MPDSSPRSGSPVELDELTLARARRGDPSACRALIERYQRPVFALLGRMLRPAGRDEEIEDLAQESFLRVFEALPRFQSHGRARLSTWILTITSRLAIDTLRKRYPAALPHDLEGTLPPGATETLQPEQRVLLRQIDEVLSQLRPEFRAAFVLRVFHELPYQEIADLLEVDLGTVKSRISRTRAALRSASNEVDHDQG